MTLIRPMTGGRRQGSIRSITRSSSGGDAVAHEVLPSGATEQTSPAKLGEGERDKVLHDGPFQMPACQSPYR